MTIRQSLEYQLVDLAEKLATACINGDKQRAKLLIRISNTCGKLLSLAEHDSIYPDYRSDGHSISVTRTYHCL